MMMPVNWKVRQLLGQGGSPGTELIESWCAGITGPTCQGEVCHNCTERQKGRSAIRRFSIELLGTSTPIPI